MMDWRHTLGMPSRNGDVRIGWLPLLPCIFALLAWGGDACRKTLQYDRHALAAGQWWRLLGAHLVHLPGWHWVYNALGVVLLWMLFVRELRARQWLIVAAASVLAVDAGLWWLAPQVQWYVGASGALHGLWAAGAWRQWQRSDWRTWLPSLLLLAKLAYEQWSDRSAVLAGMPVVVDAHLYGAAGGALAVWALRWRRGASL